MGKLRKGVGLRHAVCMLLVVGAWYPAAAVQATLVADAHVSSAQPDVNSGTLSNLNVGGGYTTLVQFDLGVLPAGTTAAQITRATLRLYCNLVTTPGAISVQPLNAAWGEYSVTYNTLPAVGAATGSVQVPAAGEFVTIDVTAAVQGWVSAPATNNGLALTATSTVVQFDSKENDETAHAPELEIALAAGGAGSVGGQGPAGPAGPAGPTGLQGLPGPQGLVGPVGPAGATGPAGPAGPSGAGAFAFQGAYSSSTSYSQGDVVSFGGSSYISLQDANHGNTPSTAPLAWGTLASGAAGPQGPAGPNGPAGPSGPAGASVQGPAGPTGAQGPGGPAGSPGLVYQGAYSPATNYALGDVVLLNGASWVSLLGGNHGQTPGLSPSSWGTLTAQGPAGASGPQGPAGPTGASGALGPVGPPGEKGDQGLQGVPGQAGAQGLTGATGPAGPQGPAGAQGPVGPTGLSFQGGYDPTHNYALADAVLWQGAGWVSLLANNHGNAPDQSPAAWSMYASAGGAGPAGPAGVQGVAGPAGGAGPQGASGPAGPAGPTGPAGKGLNFTGPYASATSYAVGDVVSYGGSTYTSLTPANHGQTPDVSPSAWMLLAAQGTTGAAGPAGGTGAVGPQGPAGSTGATGAQGADGPAGPAGAPGVNFRGAWTAATNYAVNDAVTFGGSTYLAQAPGSNQEPDLSPAAWAVLAQVGGAGPTGPTGSAATVAIGSVTTLAAGSAATVSNSGTEQEAVLNFGIPQGAAGTGGSGTGGSGNFAAMYHPVSFNTLYYALNSPNASASETDAVLAWIPAGCTATRLDVTSNQSGPVKVTLRVGTSRASMSDTALVCTPSVSGSCPALGSVTIPAGSFVDLRIDFASGTTAGVWTALQCN